MTKNTLLPYDSEQHTNGSEWWDRRNKRNSRENTNSNEYLAGYLARIRINWYFGEYRRPNIQAYCRAGHYRVLI